MSAAGAADATMERLGKDKLRAMYARMVTIRRFELRVRSLFLEGVMPGTIHQCDGQEASAVGVCAALEPGDIIASTHRPHGHAIAKGLSLREITAELFGRTAGCCKGRGGSMHIGDIGKGMLPANAIVGANIPIITGVALGFRLAGRRNVAVSFFGDGASNEGAFHEGINLAAVYDLPALFVCENNLYGASTHISLACRIKDIADRALAYGIEGRVADGNDVLAVYEAARHLADRAREGRGPALLELKTYRQAGQSRRDAKRYMDKAEMEHWLARDPLTMFARILLESGAFSRKDLDAVTAEVETEIDDAVDFARSAPLPAPEDALLDVYKE
jgi:TPP-dependent pyruvate/acetoin dehydrogenase alpha subunit